MVAHARLGFFRFGMSKQHQAHGEVVPGDRCEV